MTMFAAMTLAMELFRREIFTDRRGHCLAHLEPFSCLPIILCVGGDSLSSVAPRWVLAKKPAHRLTRAIYPQYP